MAREDLLLNNERKTDKDIGTLYRKIITNPDDIRNKQYDVILFVDDLINDVNSNFAQYLQNSINFTKSGKFLIIDQFLSS